jgi:hypothetical protein
VLVDLGAGCQFDGASMVSSQLGGGAFIVLTLYAHSDHTTGASNLASPELTERLATAPFCYRQSDMWALGLMTLQLLLGREQGDALANIIFSKLSAVGKAVAATRSDRDVTSALLQNGARDRPLSWQGVATAASQRGASADTVAALQAMGEAVAVAVRAVLVSGVHHGELAVQVAAVVHGMLQFCPTSRLRADEAILALETVLWCDFECVLSFHLSHYPTMQGPAAGRGPDCRRTTACCVTGETPTQCLRCAVAGLARQAGHSRGWCDSEQCVE